MVWRRACEEGQKRQKETITPPFPRPEGKAASDDDSGLLGFGPAKMNFAGAGDGGDEGRFGSVAEVAHFVEGEFEGCGHVLTCPIAGGKDELTDGMNFQRAFLKQIVTDTFVP